MKDDIWYDKDGCLSRNAMISYCIGGRGVGKTFAYKEWCLKGEGQFIWIRRYGTEVKKVQKNFLNDLIKEGRIEPDEFKVEKNIVYKGKEVKGYLLPLSKALLEKSVNYSDVTKIVFDECLLMPGVYTYLQEEVWTLLELIETVNRTREFRGEQPVKTICIGNKVDFDNPHFAYWNIEETDKRYSWGKGKKGLVLLENYDNEAFKEEKRRTKMGRLVAGTPYGDYAIENKALLGSTAFIAVPPDGFRTYCLYNVKTDGRVYGVWICDDSNWYCMEKHVDGRPTLSCSIGEHEEKRYYMGSFKGIAKTIASRYSVGGLRFENAKVKTDMMRMMFNFGGLKRV